jgi:hypothetical protein
MTSLLTKSYNNKIKTQNRAIECIDFYVMLCYGHRMEYIACVMYLLWATVSLHMDLLTCVVHKNCVNRLDCIMSIGERKIKEY